MSNRTALRMRVLPRFPARISATNGLEVVQDNLDLVVRPDFGSLVQVPSVSSPTTTFFWGWDSSLDSYSSISFQNLVENIQDVIIGENLAGIDALTVSANQVPYYLDGDGTASTYTVSSFVRGVSDAADASAFRSDIGLGGAAVLSVGTTAGTVAAGDDSRITGAAQKTSNLSDLANAGTARANLGLGGSATLNVGTSAGTVAAGDDSRIVNALQPDGSGDLPFDKVPAEAVVRLIEFDIRQSQFAGGAPMNGIDDDAPALQAAVDYAKTLGGRFTGGMGMVRLPRGQIRLGSTIDLYSSSVPADKVRIEGEGSGSTNVNIAGNFVGFNSDAPAASGLYGTQFANFMVTGPGRSNVNAYAFDIDALNAGRFENIEVFSCRRAYSLAHQWQTTLLACRAAAPLGDSLSCYDGLYLKDGEAAIMENAVEVIGGKIQGCERYGLRGESLVGSTIMGLEVVMCGDVGMYLGESPSGKDLKWICIFDCLVDTCGQLVIAKKGTSTVSELLQFSSMWLGNATASTGIGVNLNGLKHSTFSADIVVNTVYAANIENCENVAINLDTVKDYDKLLSGSPAVICNNTIKSRFSIGTTRKQATSPSATAFIEQGTANYNLVTGVFDGAVTTIGANSNKVGTIIT